MKLKSTQVEVFPIAKQRKQILEGDKNLVRGTKILTEKNISNIIRQLLGEASPGFVISCTQDITTKLYNVEFNLYGYYFNISDLTCSKLKNRSGEHLPERQKAQR